MLLKSSSSELLSFNPFPFLGLIFFPEDRAVLLPTANQSVFSQDWFVMLSFDSFLPKDAITEIPSLYFLCAEKVIDSCTRLVDFSIRLVNSVLNFSDEQVKFLGGIQITEEL